MTIIALDPGISTGVAIHDKTDEYDSVSRYITLVIRQVTDIWDVIDKHQPTICVFENFAAGGLISKEGQQTLRLVGAIEVVCYMKHIQCVMQFPQERYPFLPIAREMLQQIKRTPISHEVDALAHLLLYEDRVARGVQDSIASKRTRQI